MNIEQIKETIAQINEIKSDYEAAHSMEDELFQDVLRAIANFDDEDDPRELAREALKSLDLDFARYMA